jgi:23S rRNA (uridine2552-2'-O)-methyltransferase
LTRRDRRWITEHRRDAFVRRARVEDYRSRAVYKLEEIDRRDRLFRPGQLVFDLGAAPGGWSQYAARRVGPRGRVIAVDILPLDPVEHVEFVQGDFTAPATVADCLARLGEARADLVISDLAPNLSGIRATDQARSMELAEHVLEFASLTLKPGGALLVKLFQGDGTDAWRAGVRQRFQKLMTRKPDASRDSSREFYVLATGYRV